MKIIQENKMMLALAAGGLIVAGGIVATSAQASPSEQASEVRPQLQEVNVDTAVSELSENLSILAEGQTAADVIIGGKFSENYVADTTRLIGSEGAVSYFSAVNTQGQICLVTSVPDSADGFTGTTCADEETFLKHGVGMQFVTPEKAYRAYLVPDQAAPEAPSARSLSLNAETDSNLVTVDPLSPESRSDINVPSDGDTVTLRAFDEPDFDL